MKLITWNVNGLRTLKDSWESLFNTFNADIICFQETKLSRRDVSEWMAYVTCFSSYFAFPKYQSGYSGVVTYCGDSLRPLYAENGLMNWTIKCKSNTDNSIVNGEITDDSLNSLTQQEIVKLDTEGRVIVTVHNFFINDTIINLYIFNVYCPRADPDKPERVEFKLNFYKLLESKVRHVLRDDVNNYVIILGDFNVAHENIDICEPCDDLELTPSRKWIKNLLTPHDDPKVPYFVDAFRHLYPNRSDAFTCWCTLLNARVNNYGTRIDYILVDSRLTHLIKDCVIMSDVMGSDHCPVSIEFRDMKPHPCERFPKICTRYWPEFGGCRQQSLTSFLRRTNDSDEKFDNECKSKNKKLKTKQMNLSHFFTSQTKSITLSNEKNDYKKSYSQNESSLTTHHKQNNGDAAVQWKNILKGPLKVPNCSGHNEKCVMRVAKNGNNSGKQFFVCARPIGLAHNKESNCKFFEWAHKK